MGCTSSICGVSGGGPGGSVVVKVQNGGTNAKQPEWVTLDLTPFLPEWYVSNNGSVDSRALAFCKQTWKKIGMSYRHRLLSSPWLVLTVSLVMR